MRVHRNSSRRCLALAATTLVLFGVGGCTQKETAPANLVDIVADIWQSPPELEYAAELIANECLLAHGIDAPTPILNPAPSDTYLGLVGVFQSRDAAADYGYATTQDLHSIETNFVEGLSPEAEEAYTTAYFGGEDATVKVVEVDGGAQISESTQGCLAEGRVAVYGSVEGHLEYLALLNSSTSALGDDVTGLSAADGGAYTQCMKDSGYSVDGFNAFSVAESKFGTYRAEGQPPSEEESAMAIADYICQTQVGLIEKLKTHYAEQAGSWVLANESRLLAYRQLENESLARAKEIIVG